MMAGTEKKLSKESIITVLSLLKSFYDEEVFRHLTKEYYNSDLDISITAIQSSAAIANESAVPHLYTMIEKGKMEQKIAAIRALSVIKAPSSIVKLIKYFHLFPAKEIRAEIIGSLNMIAPGEKKYQELVVTLVGDTQFDEDIRTVASDALFTHANVVYLASLLKTAPLKIKKNLIKKALHLPSERAGDFFDCTPELLKSLDAESLGYFLAGYLLFGKQADQKLIISMLMGKTKGAVAFFLQALLECTREIAQPLKVFKTLLILPYINSETEKLTGNSLEKIVVIMRERSPFVLNELATITVAHLEAISGKIKKNFLSLAGVVQKEGLLSLLFARLIENFATPLLLEDVQRYFKGSKYLGENEIIGDIKTALVDASEEEKNQFRACLPLFNPNKKADHMKTITMLANVDLGRPFLLRRLNRFIRLAGLLGIKTLTKNLQKILDFARSERITFLEETTMVSLCQLYDKITLDRGAAYLSNPLEDLPTLKGYVRGLRFCLPPLHLKELAELLLKPEVSAEVKVSVLSTFEQFDLKQARGVVPIFIRAFFLLNADPLLRERLEKLICQWGAANIFQVTLGFLSSPERPVRLLAIQVLRDIALRDATIPREVLVNRYYLLLEEDDKEIKQEALIALLYLKDDYAIQVFGDYFKKENSSDVPALLARLPHPLAHEVVRFLFKQIGNPEVELQRTLRVILLEVTKGDDAEELRHVLLDYLGSQSGKVISFTPAEKQSSEAGLLEQAKLEFKFKRENAQILTVFFCDIVSYTEKSAIVNTSTLMTLIRSFEGVVFPVIKEFRGQIIKTLGDGILAVFKQPLNAVLAAISIQKKVREHNQYKVDEEKFFLRIGLNTGLVIRKLSDIYGDVVNIASRMQAAANPGDILLTHDTYLEIENYIKCTPLGKIKVKGKEAAIPAYTAQEVKVDFNHLLAAGTQAEDAAKKTRAVDPITNLKESMFTPSFAIPLTIASGRNLLKEMEKLFHDITSAIEEIAKDYHEEYEFKKYLQKRWDVLLKNWDKNLADNEENASPAVS